MKKEFSLKNLKSIEIDKENNLAIAHYEEKPALKVGQWYSANECNFVLYLGVNNKSNRFFKGAGFTGGECVDVNDEACMYWEHGDWKPADMQEVKKLLIKEAEKKYGTIPRKDTNLGGTLFFDSGDIVTNGWFSNRILFDSKTGKWAEIAKEPLKYVIKLTETTKAFPNETFYKCEIGSILNDTKDKSKAFIFEHFEGAKTVCVFIEESYDFKAEIIDYK